MSPISFVVRVATTLAICCKSSGSPVPSLSQNARHAAQEEYRHGSAETTEFTAACPAVTYSSLNSIAPANSSPAFPADSRLRSTPRNHATAQSENTLFVTNDKAQTKPKATCCSSLGCASSNSRTTSTQEEDQRKPHCRVSPDIFTSHIFGEDTQSRDGFRNNATNGSV